MASIAKSSTASSTRKGFDAGSKLDPPTNALVNSLLTDMYQITMSYAYWKGGKHNDHAVFDLFFRKNPFKGEFTVFGGLEEVCRHVDNFSFSAEQVEYVKSLMPHADAGFFEYLSKVDCAGIKVYAIDEGSVVFPREAVIRIEGPLAVAQLLETTLLCLCNYASLMATNAARFRQAAGDDKALLEFGLRRAQGPDGAMSASRYSYLGGFDGTSNVLAGHTFGITPKGTHAHAFVSSFTGLADVADPMLTSKDGSKKADLIEEAKKYRAKLPHGATCHDGELAAFVSYALAFPDGFLALVDTYDTIQSGLPNFLSVALVLLDLGYTPRGIRLDSGDLAFLSKEARKQFTDASKQFGVELSKATIVASNGINEGVLHALNTQGHEIDAFGIGTNLVTCQAQPALGMVYKLVQINGKPRIKLSEEIAKVTIPGRKESYRLIGASGAALADIMIQVGEKPPQAGEKVLCRHPFDEKKRVFVTPTKVMPLLSLYWAGKDVVAASATGGSGAGGGAGAGAGAGGDGEALHHVGLQIRLPSLDELRAKCKSQIVLLRDDHVRSVNPAPYKVSVSDKLYTFLHELWSSEQPIKSIS